MRVERDYIGKMLLPDRAYYGIQTERSYNQGASVKIRVYASI